MGAADKRNCVPLEFHDDGWALIPVAHSFARGLESHQAWVGRQQSYVSDLEGPERMFAGKTHSNDDFSVDFDGYPLVMVHRQFLDVGDHSELQAGMEFSIEPGLYVPGLGGFRHSDKILVTGDGCLGHDLLSAGAG